MSYLKLGPMTSAELAAWFGVKEGTYRNNKAKKLEALKNFAKFDVMREGVVIKEIIEPEYSKAKSIALQKVQKEVDRTWSKTGLDSCKRVSMKIEEKLKNELSISQDTYYKYTKDTKRELYGVPFQDAGKLGVCSYQWCKKQGDGADAVLVPFNEDEEKIKADLMKKYFGNTTEKQILVKGMVETGEIKKEEAWEVLENMTNMGNYNFMGFLMELQEKLNCKVIRGTYVERFAAGLVEEKYKVLKAVDGVGVV